MVPGEVVASLYINLRRSRDCLCLAVCVCGCLCVSDPRFIHYALGKNVDFIHVYVCEARNSTRLACLRLDSSYHFNCLWGAVVQWLERATDNRVVAGSIPAEAVWKLCQFPLPHFASVFRKTLKAVGPFYLVSMPGEVKYLTSLHWKCVTYRRLHHPLLETTRHHGPHWK